MLAIGTLETDGIGYGSRRGTLELGAADNGEMSSVTASLCSVQVNMHLPRQPVLILPCPCEHTCCSI